MIFITLQLALVLYTHCITASHLEQINAVLKTRGTCNGLCKSTRHLHGIQVTCLHCLPQIHTDYANLTTELILNAVQETDQQHRSLFRQVPNLRRLVLKNSQITNFTQLFDDVGLVEELDINYNSFAKYMDDKCFEKLRNLRRLRIKGLRYVPMHIIKMSLQSVHSVKLDTIVIDFVGTQTSESMASLDSEFFKPFNRANLKHVVMTNLNIMSLKYGFSKYIKNVTCLDLSGNGLTLTTFDVAYDFISMDKLRIFDMSYAWAKDLFLQPSLSKICIEPLNRSTEVGYINHAVINDTRRLQNSMTFSLPRNVRYIIAHDLDGIQQKPRPPNSSLNVFPSNNVRYVDFSGFPYKMDFPITGFLRLQYLNLQDCKIERLMYHTFMNFPSLETLLLGRNNLGNWFTNVNATFALKESKLTSLDLAYNEINFISIIDFKFIVSIQIVNLTFNRITSESIDYDCEFSFINLNLSYNSIIHLPDNFRRSFDLSVAKVKQSTGHPSDASKRDHKIDLTGNPLLCSCQTLQFIIWLRYHEKHFHASHKYWCKYNLTLVLIASFNVSVLHAQCYTNLTGLTHINNLNNVRQVNNLILKGAVSGSVAFVILVTMVFFIYRHRQLLTYYIWFVPYVKARSLIHSCLDGFVILDEESSYTHDVFVLCSNHDAAFVNEHIKPELLTRGFTVLFGDEDFPLHECIFTHVKKAMRSSSCALLVLSAAFLKSPWLNYELTMAIVMKRAVIIVKLNEPSYSSMPAALKYIYNTYQTRQRYPINHPEQLHKFWNQLTKAISKFKNVVY